MQPTSTHTPWHSFSLSRHSPAFHFTLGCCPEYLKLAVTKAFRGRALRPWPLSPFSQHVCHFSKMHAYNSPTAFRPFFSSSFKCESPSNIYWWPSCMQSCVLVAVSITKQVKTLIHASIKSWIWKDLNNNSIQYSQQSDMLCKLEWSHSQVIACTSFHWAKPASCFLDSVSTPALTRTSVCLIDLVVLHI